MHKTKKSTTHGFQRIEHVRKNIQHKLRLRNAQVKVEARNSYNNPLQPHPIPNP